MINKAGISIFVSYLAALHTFFLSSIGKTPKATESKYIVGFFLFLKTLPDYYSQKTAVIHTPSSIRGHYLFRRSHTSPGYCHLLRVCVHAHMHNSIKLWKVMLTDVSTQQKCGST